jgi:hypothetical protein
MKKHAQRHGKEKNKKKRKKGYIAMSTYLSNK